MSSATAVVCMGLPTRGGSITGKLAAWVAIGMLAGPACSKPSSGSEDPSGNTEPSEEAEAGARQREAAAAHADKSPSVDAPLPIPPINKRSIREHPAGQAWVFADGKAGEKLSIEQAEARGLTVVDLGDGWVPYIFSNKTPGVENGTNNSYAKRYRDLANDRTDRDGDRLPAHSHNFLELYGIPPSLSVIAGEFDRVEGDDQRCLETAGYDPSVFEIQRGIPFRKRSGPRRLSRHKSATKRLHKAMRAAKIAAGDYESAATHPRTKGLYAKWKPLDEEVAVIRQAQIRFRCERLFPTRRGLGNFRPGNFDGQVHMALAAFEKKHNIRGWGHFTANNLRVLGQTAVESTHARLLRILRERVLSAAGIVEDGSAARRHPDFQWTDANGQNHGLRDLATEFSDALIAALGIGDSNSAHEVLDRLGELESEGFSQLLIAFKGPSLPEYHVDDMQFSVVIDRGDVWYEFLYDDEGNKRPQPRKRFPHLTLYTNYRDQKIPLVDWRTTIGSWRSEQHEGKEWLAYKNSDIGPRVWKNIVAAPTWIPPMITPIRGLVKNKISRGKRVRVVNYDETGPSYTSAYGLVAAYHIRQIRNSEGEVIREHDNQIRTHGSVDYMSIMRRYSHGCHRLYNMSAVELFSFILQHRDYEREGQVKIGYKREFEYEEDQFLMELDTRGYRYTLNDPIPVNVLEGRIRGKRKKPYVDLMEKPGVDYTDETEVLLDENGNPILPPGDPSGLIPGQIPGQTPGQIPGQLPGQIPGIVPAQPSGFPPQPGAGPAGSPPTTPPSELPERLRLRRRQ